MKNTLKVLLIYIILVGVIVFGVGFFVQNPNTPKQESYTSLIQNIKEDKVKQVTLNDTSDLASYKVGDKNYYTNIPDVNAFLTAIKDQINDGHVQIDKQTDQFSKTFDRNLKNVALILGIIGGFILIIGILRLTAKKSENMPTQDMLFGKSKARLLEKGENDTLFDDVAGIDEEKEELTEIVDFLKNPDKYIQMGARIPKGILLVGRPGTGKTLLAKAVAGEAGVPFFSISGSDFVEMYVGVGAKRVREMFAEAKRHSPCIIFIDEIDAVGRQRGAGLGGGHDEREQTLNQLLVEMDGFGKNAGVIVLAATNRPDVLDSALLRAGRFDRQIVVSMPDSKARLAILKIHAQGKKLADDVKLEVIAQNTPGCSGADLENILNEAALLAARNNHNSITNQDIQDATVKVSMGTEKKSKVMSQKERKLVSYHEAGHAVVSYFLETKEKVHEISIIPRGMAGGYTMYKPSEDKSFVSQKEMEEMIVGLLGGRLAEELVLVDVSTGASNDIQRATQIAKDMVTKYGMSKEIGAVCLSSQEEQVFLGREIATHKNMSESTASKVDDEVRKIINSAYVQGKEILTQNIDKLHSVAKVLMDKEKITGEEFDAIMKGKK